jgi:plasmid stabilization system protein ParE
MGKRTIIWSHRARIRLFEILEYYADRNKSKTFSVKLYHKFNKELSLIVNHPEIGIKTEIESVRGMIIDDYIFFYELSEDKIIVHTLWSSRKRPDNLIIK